MKYRNEIFNEIAHHYYEISQWNIKWNRPSLLWNIAMKYEMKLPWHYYEMSQWNRPPNIMKYRNEIWNEITLTVLWNIVMKYEMKSPTQCYEISQWNITMKSPGSNEIFHLIICLPLYTTYGRDLPRIYHKSGYHQSSILSELEKAAFTKF